MQALWNIKPGVVSLLFILAGSVSCLYSSTGQMSWEEMTSATIKEPIRTSTGQSAFVSIRQQSYETHIVTFTEYSYRDFGAILVFVGLLAEIGICLRSRIEVKEKEEEIGIY